MILPLAITTLFICPMTTTIIILHTSFLNPLLPILIFDYGMFVFIYIMYFLDIIIYIVYVEKYYLDSHLKKKLIAIYDEHVRENHLSPSHWVAKRSQKLRNVENKGYDLKTELKENPLKGLSLYARNPIKKV